MSQNAYDGFGPVHHCASPESAAQSPFTFSDVLCAAAALFNDTAPAGRNAAVAAALRSVAEYLGAETARVCLYGRDRETAGVISAWPDDHRKSARSAGTLTIPMSAGGSAIGACRFTGIPGGKRHPEPVTGELKLFGALLAGFLLRIRSEQAHSETRESMDLLLDSTHDAIGMLDRDHTILSANHEFAGRFGKKPDELIGRCMDEFALTPQAKAIFIHRRALFDSVFETQQPASLEDCREGRWLDNRFFPVFSNGQVVAVTIVSADITDRKQLEAEKEARIALQAQAAERREREQEYLEILDSSTEGSFVVDFESGTTRYSENWMKRLGLTGLPPSALLERFLDRMDPEDAARIKADRNRAEALSAPRFRREYRIADKDGQPLWVMIQGRLLYNDEGRLIKSHGTFIDITSRKEMELALRRQAEELAEQNRLNNNFFMNISHEFRTPLSVLMMQLDMMGLHLEEARCAYSGGIKDVNREMRANVYRLMHLVDNILDITKAEAGCDSPDLVNTDVVALTAQITDAVRAYIADSGPHVSFSSDTPSRLMPADQGKLEKILLNLLSNAVKHSPRGGRVQVTLRNASSSILLSVSDEGGGIPGDMIGTIFDRFRQAGSLTRMHEGCGIGLALTRALVELLGGRICAESRPGHGARFFVELPVPPSAAPSKRISQDGLSLAERVEIAFSEVRLDNAPHHHPVRY